MLSKTIKKIMIIIYFQDFLIKTQKTIILRKIMNIFFIKLTKILTGINLTDPGSSTMIVSQKFF